MSFPLGVVAYPAVVATPKKSPNGNGNPSKNQFKGDSPRVTSSNALGPSFFKQHSSPPKAKSPRDSASSSSTRGWSFRFSHRKSRGESPSSTRQGSDSAPLLDQLKHSPTAEHHTTPHDSFELADPSPDLANLGRPKHLPTGIPSEYPSTESEHLASESDTSPVSPSGNRPSFRYHLFPSPPRDLRFASRFPTPRHVALVSRDLGQSVPGPDLDVCLSPAVPPVLTRTSDRPDSPCIGMSRTTPDSSRTNTMDSNTSYASPERAYGNRSHDVSGTNLSSAYSSQASLTGMRAEYESASETGDTHPDGAPGSQTPQNRRAASQNANTATSNLSGLVCNAHRTTGKKPHPLVGAATTVLGDKLYVFGGRRLSRTQSHQLTSNLYELDLVKRHWTKINHLGDIPPPRYFHSVCALGDNKLVCYGGMSPSPQDDTKPEPKSEVVVMSDVHIFNVVTQTWTKLATPDAPQGRYAHCATILPSAAVFASRDAPLSGLHHNPAGATPNSGSLGVTLDGTGGAEMVIVGGQDSANQYIEQVSIFNLRSLKWTGTTGMGRSCGAYRSVCTPLTSMSVNAIGAGPHGHDEDDEDDEEESLPGSGAPMLIYSNYNFLDVRLELQIRLTDGTLIEKPMQPALSPPGLRFPNGGIIDNHFVVSGTFLTSSKQEYELWALDLRTLAWSRIDAGGSIFQEGSWNKGVLWNRRNAFVVLGDRRRNLVDDYNNRRINFNNICIVELEAFGLYENPRTADPTSSYVSASATPSQPSSDSLRKLLSSAATDLGMLAMSVRELADMDFLAIDGTRIPVNSRLIARRWGPHFISLLRESLASASDTETATLRASGTGHPSRNSSVTITSPSVSSGATTLTSLSNGIELPDTRNTSPGTRPRLFYLPHTAPTLHALLHYLYTSTLPSPPHSLATPQIFCSLLQLARPYKIEGLLEAVVERLHESLDGRNAAAIFNAAAMGAGGGDSVHFAKNDHHIRHSDIPVRTASLAGIDSLLSNGGGRSVSSLRIDTDMANGRSARNTLRPARGAEDETDEEDVPQSAATDASVSDAELPLSPGSFTDRPDKGQEVWNGSLSAVAGLQKRGLRGLMEGRRMRERRPDGAKSEVGLGIA